MDEEQFHQWPFCENVDVKPGLPLDIKVKVEDQFEHDESSGPEYEDEAEMEEEPEWTFNEDAMETTTTNWTESTTSDDFNNEQKEKRASVSVHAPLRYCPIAGCTAPPFTKTKELKDHKIRCHSSFPCPLCFITPFSNLQGYVTHTTTVHAEWNATSRRQYNCELCPPDKRPYKRLAMWRHHIDAHLRKVPRDMRKNPGILKIHPCSLYDDEYVLPPRPPPTLNDDKKTATNDDTKPTVNSTMSENPTPTPPIPTKSRRKRFICNFKQCSGEFPDSKSLAAHQQIHQNVEKRVTHSCPVKGCPMRYRTLSSFNQHVQQCQLQLPLICPVENCGREFRDVRCLNNHKKVHNNKVVYFTCPVEGCNEQLRKGKFGAHSHIKRCRREWRMRTEEAESRLGEVSGVKALQNTDEGTTTQIKQEGNEYEQQEPADSWNPIMDLPLKLEVVEGGEMEPPPDPFGPIVCPLCPHPIFKYRKTQREHMNSAHAGHYPGEHKCEVCPPEMPPFLTLTMWRHHIDGHLKKIPKKLRKTPGILKIYSCALTDPDHSGSGSGSGSGSLAATSTVPGLPSKRFICSFDNCYIEFEDSFSLKEHEQGHKTLLTYHCPMEGCTRTFRGWGYLFMHMQACERKTLEKRREGNLNQEDEMEPGVNVKVEPEVGMEMNIDTEQSEEEQLGIRRTRNRSIIKGHIKGMTRCPVEGCNRLMRVGSLNYHIRRCQAGMERRRQRGECLEDENDNGEVEEKKPPEKVQCPVEGCSRMIVQGGPLRQHMKKCQREQDVRQREAAGDTYPKRRGHFHKKIRQDGGKSSETTQIPSGPISMVTGTVDWAPALQIAPQEDLPSQLETQIQAPQATGSKDENLFIVSEL